MIRSIMGTLLLATLVMASQVVGVKLGHPDAVWLWCDMLRLCEVSK